jgi:hypothetical protein
MEAFTWRNLVRRKDGPAADRRLLGALVVILALEVLSVAAARPRPGPPLQ